MAFSPDGSRLVLGNAGGMLAWEHSGRGEIQPLEFVVPDPANHEELEPILSLAYTPDGRCIAAGRTAGRVSLYCFSDGGVTAHEVFEATEGTGRIDGLTLDPVRQVLLTAAGDGTVRQAPLRLRLYGESEWDLLEFYADSDVDAQRARIASEYSTALERLGLQLNEQLDLTTVQRTTAGDTPPPDADPNAMGFLDPKIRAQYYPTRSEVGDVEPINDSGQFEWRDRFCHFRRVSLNNEGNVIRVRPGSEVSLSTWWEAGVRPTKKTYCPGCIVQFYIGIHDQFETCLFSDVMQPAYFRGKSGKLSTSFTAPQTPGIYYLTFRHSLLYGCAEDPSKQPEDPSKAFAALVVE